MLCLHKNVNLKGRKQYAVIADVSNSNGIKTLFKEKVKLTMLYLSNASFTSELRYIMIA